MRVAIAADELRAIGEAIARGTAIEIAARVLDSEDLRAAGLKPGDVIAIEVHGHDHESAPGRSAFVGEERSIEPLTQREREVLDLVAEGMSNRAIAERLGISEHTVKFHVGSLLGKLSAATRAELVAVAVRRGVIML